MAVISLLCFLCLVQVNFASRPRGNHNSTLNCEGLADRATECVQTGIGFLDLNFEPPRDADGVNEFCSSRSQYVKCARQYIQCLRMVPRQMYIIIIQNVNKLLRDVCAPEKKKELVENMRCVNRRTLHVIADPVSLLAQHYNFISNNVTRDDDLIPWTCCAYFSFYHQLEDSLRRLCRPAVTPPQTIQFFFNSISQVVSDAIDVGCGQYSSKEACDSRNPQAMKIFSGKHFDLSSRIDFLTPLLEIAKRIS